MPHSITAEFCLNTPLFSSGADRTKPELRVSEIKAALRFWWRTMNYRLLTDPEGCITQLSKRESELFGSTQGQSPFLLRMLANNIDASPIKSATELVTSNKAQYLGYGLAETDAKRFGKAADSCPTFTIELTLKAKAVDYQQEYINTLKLFGLFGGLGYRSRRGFGSVTLQKLWINNEEQTLPDAAKAYDQLFNKDDGLLSQCPCVGVAPEYSAFVKNTSFCRIVALQNNHPPFSTGMNALDAVAGQFKTLLTGPSPGTPRQQTGRSVRLDDVSWAYMGLPRKYGTGSAEHHPGVLPDQRNLEELERRASPLFFHVYKAGQGDYRVVAILFKSRFLPDGYGVVANHGTAIPLPTPPASGYDWIDTWLTSIGADIPFPTGTP